VHATQTTLESLRGCTCKPSYYVFWRDLTGASRKTARVHDRRLADKLLREKQVDIDKGLAGYEEQANITFPEWADEYEERLQSRPGMKGSTRRAYAGTLAIARDTIGHVVVRRIGSAELRRFYSAIAHTSDATQLKHLRHLNACLSAAASEQPPYLERSPVGLFVKPLRLKAPKGTPSFTDGELAAILSAMGDEEPVYAMVVRAAVATGCRLGELIALDWSAVDLIDRTIRVRHTYDSIDGLTTPKDNDERTVYLTREGEATFAAWLMQAGAQAEGIVFPAPRGKGRLNADYVRKLVNEAMTRAGVRKVDPRSRRPRKPLHSLRATYARQQLEAGRNPQWVESNLGHADLELTVHTYGSWSDEAMRAEAER
jgi:integrase